MRPTEMIPFDFADALCVVSFLAGLFALMYDWMFTKQSSFEGSNEVERLHKRVDELQLQIQQMLAAPTTGETSAPATSAAMKHVGDVRTVAKGSRASVLLSVPPTRVSSDQVMIEVHMAQTVRDIAPRRSPSAFTGTHVLTAGPCHSNLAGSSSGAQIVSRSISSPQATNNEDISVEGVLERARMGCATLKADGNSGLKCQSALEMARRYSEQIEVPSAYG